METEQTGPVGEGGGKRGEPLSQPVDTLARGDAIRRWFRSGTLYYLDSVTP